MLTGVGRLLAECAQLPAEIVSNYRRPPDAALPFEPDIQPESLQEPAPATITLQWPGILRSLKKEGVQ